MGAYVVTTRTSVADLISGALTSTHVYRFGNTVDALGALIRNGDSRSALIILDLTSVPDAARFIAFVKSSAVIRALPLVAIATKEEIKLLELTARDQLDASLDFPCTPADIAATFARFNQ